MSETTTEPTKAEPIEVVVFDDPGHGWLRIRKADMKRLGIGGEITSYSYQKGQYAYLEEDQDAGVAIDKAAALGIPLVYGQSHYSPRSSPIRSYDRWSA